MDHRLSRIRTWLPHHPLQLNFGPDEIAAMLGDNDAPWRLLFLATGLSQSPSKQPRDNVPDGVFLDAAAFVLQRWREPSWHQEMPDAVSPSSPPAPVLCARQQQLCRTTAHQQIIWAAFHEARNCP